MKHNQTLELCTVKAVLSEEWLKNSQGQMDIDKYLKDRLARAGAEIRFYERKGDILTFKVRGSRTEIYRTGSVSLGWRATSFEIT